MYLPYWLMSIICSVVRDPLAKKTRAVLWQHLHHVRLYCVPVPGLSISDR